MEKFRRPSSAELASFPQTVRCIYLLAEEQNLGIIRLLERCDIPQTTFFEARRLHRDLKHSTVERICTALQTPLGAFYSFDDAWEKRRSGEEAENTRNTH